MIIGGYPIDPKVVCYLKTSHGKITDVGEHLLKLTGYEECDFLNKEASYVFKYFLRCTIDINTIDHKAECFLFTRSLHAKNAIIHTYKTENPCERKIIIHVQPIPHSTANLPWQTNC